MSRTPALEVLPGQHYVGVSDQVSPDALAPAIDTHLPRLFAWLGARGVVPAGPPFVRYYEVDMNQGLSIEVGVPVAEAVSGIEDPIRPGLLPGGTYVTNLHVGGYDGLMEANADVLRWGEEHGFTWAMDGPSQWQSRFEQYLTDPRLEPDPSSWQTLVAFLTAD